MNTDKKISFGFSKLVKKSSLLNNKLAEEKKVELVECLEGKSIKIKDAIEIVEKPLVIPIKDNNKNLLDRIKASKTKQKEYSRKDVKQEEVKPNSKLTIDELAARELINDAKLRLENGKATKSNLVLPIKEDKLSFEGEEEPKLEDYESVPISDYGMAMLRGMGWKEGMSIGKNSAKLVVPNIPELRPKGLGLGATKILKADLPNQTACDKDGNVLILKKGSFAKIIAGSHKGNYCEVLGLDDEAGRVIVKTSLKNEILTLNEFLIIPVTKEEYCKSSKVLNNSKYEKYLEKAEKNIKEFDDLSSSSKLDRNQLKKHHFSDEFINEKQDKEQNLRKNDKSPKHHKKHTSSYRDKRSNSNSDSECGTSRRKVEEYRHRSRSNERKYHKSGTKSSKSKSDNKDYSKTHHRKGKKKKETKSKSRRRSSSSSSYSDSDRHYDRNKR